MSDKFGLRKAVFGVGPKMDFQLTDKAFVSQIGISTPESALLRLTPMVS